MVYIDMAAVELVGQISNKLEEKYQSKQRGLSRNINKDNMQNMLNRTPTLRRKQGSVYDL